MCSRVDRIASDVFGIPTLTPAQAEVISAALAGQDVVAVIPTGGGKSLCFQLPAVYDGGVSVVVSPLLALITNQVSILQQQNVAAVAFTGASDKRQLRKTPDVRLLYTTPEQLVQSTQLREWLRKKHAQQLLKRFVLDEAHCVYTWGAEFRVTYRAVAERRGEFPGVPYMALTATATQEVVSDIIRVMRSDLNPAGTTVVQTPCRRPNLCLSVQSKSRGSAGFNQLLELVLSRVRNSESGIVYVFSREDSAMLASRLQRNGVAARAFHAGLHNDCKQSVMQWWASGEVGVVVATVAFGMGIHKPDVRFVIHYSMPRSLLAYFQEVGRAGRDGLSAHCILLYCSEDFDNMSDALFRARASLAERHSLADMRAWCLNTEACRHVSLVHQFRQPDSDSDTEAMCDKMCDVCKATVVT